MDAEEWEISTDPAAMFDWLINGRCNLYRTTKDGIPVGVSDRKSRLLACQLYRLHFPGSVPEQEARIKQIEDAEDTGIRYKDGSWHLTSKTGLHAVSFYSLKLPAEADLLREIIGNPFCPYFACGSYTHCFKPEATPKTIRSEWLQWSNGTVPKMAQGIYSERTFERTPILADALEDSGCCDEVFLNHLRGGNHVRGCWCIDLLLGKE